MNIREVKIQSTAGEIPLELRRLEPPGAGGIAGQTAGVQGGDWRQNAGLFGASVARADSILWPCIEKAPRPTTYVVRPPEGDEQGGKATLLMATRRRGSRRAPGQRFPRARLSRDS
jgi:hypothetical protein